MNEERIEFVKSLREFADFLENNPGVPSPNSAYLCSPVETAEELRAAVRVMGRVQKDFSDKHVAVEKVFGGIKYAVYTNRENVCERIVVGKRIVPAVAEHEEDIVEWKCGTVLS